jgi:hypothetical protein
MEPRHFWRSVGAGVVDHSLATIASLLILLPFLGDTDKIRLDAVGFFTSSCKTITLAPDSVLAIVAPKAVEAGLVCDTTVLRQANGQTVTLIYDVTRTEYSSSQRSVTVPVDKDGNPVAPLMPQSLIDAV